MNVSNQTQTALDSTDHHPVPLTSTKQFVSTFILPSLCAIGIVTNSVSAYILSNRNQLKNQIYRYFCLLSVVELVYLSLCFIFHIIKLRIFKHIQYSFWVQTFQLYGYWCLSTSAAILIILLELIISTKRLLIIMNIHFNFKIGC